MPIYEFVCGKCGFKFEKLTSMNSNRTKEVCPQCQGQAEKAVSSFAAHSKTSGSSSCHNEHKCPSAQLYGGCNGGCPFGG